MLRRYELTDQEWEQIASLLPPEKTGKPRRPSKDNRTMLNGMVLIARSSAHGVTCRNVMDSGIQYTVVSASGLMIEFLITSSGYSALKLNFMNSQWMPQSFRLISTVQVLKKGDSKRDRTQPWRSQFQNPCSRRCLWLSSLSDT